MRRTMIAAVTGGLALLLAGSATPALSSDGRGGLTRSAFTVYEVSESLSIIDETPVRVDVFPPAPQQARPGVGDTLVIASGLYARARPFTSDTPPPPIPGAPPLPVPFATFEPVGERIGEVLGDCRFVRYVDERASGGGEDRLAQCQISFRLPQGELVAAGVLDVSGLEAARPTQLAVTGGTGAYARAQGTVTLTQPSVTAFDRFRVDVNLRG